METRELKADYSAEELEISVLQSADEMRSHSEDWDELVQDSDSTVFQTFDWQYLWWIHFASDASCKPFIVVVKSESGIIGIAPFLLQTFTMLGIGIFRQLKLLGSGLQAVNSPVLSLEREGAGDYLDVIARKGHESGVGAAIAEFLVSNGRNWDEVDLQNVAADGNFATHILPRLNTGKLEINKSVMDVCPRVRLDRPWDEYVASRDARTRRSMRRANRSFLDSGDYRLDEAKDGAEVEKAMGDLVSLHQAHWNSIGYPGLFSDARFSSMLYALARELAKKDRMWLMILRHGEEPIAVRLCFVFNGRVSDYVSGTFRSVNGKASEARSGGGIALLYLAMNRAAREGCLSFDLLRGDEAYKSSIATSVAHNYRITIRDRDAARKPMRRSAYRLTSLAFAVTSRVVCESTIYSVLAKEKGTLRALPEFIKHAASRISAGSTRIRETSQTGTFKTGNPEREKELAAKVSVNARTPEK